MNKPQNEPTLPEDTEASVSSVLFKTLKASGFNTYAADGAVGGLTPRGYVNINFYVERKPIADSYRQEVSSEGGLGERFDIKGEEGIIRELQCAVQLDIRTAIELHQWLQNMILEYQKIMSDIEEPNNSEKTANVHGDS